ncbi:GAF domain-containing protein [Aestuariibacter sp. GS-14]|uniref:GAF domain-containing protein n=1 Tax=Alteromonadaceae TaxID=72275 RepID=UPI002103B2BD|nr:GAF domain-containing protein [Aestuariibacter sp. GS-14]
MSSSTFYSQLIAQARSLVDGEHDMIANMANISALLYNQMDNVNWAGFYIFKEEQLVLGPFQGQPACIRIPMGKGVCGTAAASNTVQRIEDVHQFEGHIACDAASNSEIVIPIVVNDKLIGVLDIDSPIYSRFSAEDEAGLCEIVSVLSSTLV